MSGRSLRGSSERAPAALAARVAAEFAHLGPGDLVLAGVSGGSDSTALLHLLVRALPPRGVRVGAVHLDHGLRPESASDARFVAALAARLAVPFTLERADIAALAKRRRLGLEEAGRHARHELFARTAAAHGAAAVALAHTRDDLAETLLLHLVRGAGAAGLAAMERGHALFKRPLLDVSRSELRAFLATHGEPFLDDPSNLDLRFARARVRHQILPALAVLNPRVTEALARTAHVLAAEDEHLEGEAKAFLGEARDLDAAALAALPPALARRVALRFLRASAGYHPDLGHEHVDALLDLARGARTAAATDLPGGGRIERAGSRIRLVEVGSAGSSPLPPPADFDCVLAVPGVTRVASAGLRLTIAVAEAAPLAASGLRVQIARSALIPGSARARSATAGDRFRPLGAPGSLPLNRYLMGRKVPRAERASVAVVEGPSGIVWVVGHQVAEPARAGALEPRWLLTAEPLS